ncbi:phosphate ABC transporter substrate-binding protein [Rheinheimera sp.]|uniref:phosphate ABC transporter substrate-binding protein n=1 Tax=Rheinheimera sp. TaxID=1869214 RepID=UPI00307D8C74
MKIIAVITFFLCAALPAFADYVVIVNASNSSTISMDDVKKIYLGKVTSFPGGSGAQPVMLKERHPLREVFIEQVLGLPDSRYVALWAKMLFTGNGEPPLEVDSLERIKDLVSREPAFIGFTDESLVDDSVRVIGRF